MPGRGTAGREGARAQGAEKHRIKLVADPPATVLELATSLAGWQALSSTQFIVAAALCSTQFIVTGAEACYTGENHRTFFEVDSRRD